MSKYKLKPEKYNNVKYGYKYNIGYPSGPWKKQRSARKANPKQTNSNHISEFNKLPSMISSSLHIPRKSMYMYENNSSLNRCPPPQKISKKAYGIKDSRKENTKVKEPFQNFFPR